MPNLTRVLRASIALGHVLQAWSRTKMVPKPGRNSYILTKDFRPVSLLLLKNLGET